MIESKSMEKHKIVIVEDERILRDAIIAALNGAGFTTIAITDGKDAVETIRSEQPDLVLLDLFLPKKDGYEVLREIKSKKDTKDIRVLIFSVIEDEEMVKACIKLGAEGCIFKAGYSLENIINKIKEVLNIK